MLVHPSSTLRQLGDEAKDVYNVLKSLATKDIEIETEYS